MPEATLIFKPDGTVTGLYSELIDLSQLGKQNIQRASDIAFDVSNQVWKVWKCETWNTHPVFASKSREACLQWERKHFDKELEKA